ncbi:DNA-directed RNA polymerase subunit beta [Lacticaseibacillus zhaodongensis]|uniref:DNA-directed RNA polymerase subunit beta n=1 Tax=Lacticaseibacillus zhaodongensis TaxID=2668065 RepID=UPI0012D33EED|nr:DNA-directed RNA polymerase subunit beta [Lacticaseibacillus zhaodongensis]
MSRDVPRELWLYDDRCMMKWMGWILSDHSAYMEKEARTNIPAEPQAEQSYALINTRVQEAWENGLVLSVQSNVIADGHYLAPIEGACVGLADGQGYLQTKDGRVRAFNIADTRHVDILQPEKWWAA